MALYICSTLIELVIETKPRKNKGSSCNETK